MDISFFEETNNDVKDDISEEVRIIIKKRSAKKADTLVYGLKFSDSEFKEHLKKMKTSLGCNGSIKDEEGKKIIFLQGDKSYELSEYLKSLDIKVASISQIN